MPRPRSCGGDNHRYGGRDILWCALNEREEAMMRSATLRKYAGDIRGAARFGFSNVTHATCPIDCFEDALAPLVARLLEDEADRMERSHDRFEALPAAGAVNMSDLVPVAWIYETWIGGIAWSKRLSFGRPTGTEWQRGIVPLVPLYAAPQQARKTSGAE